MTMLIVVITAVIAAVYLCAALKTRRQCAEKVAEATIRMLIEEIRRPDGNDRAVYLLGQICELVNQQNFEPHRKFGITWQELTGYVEDSLKRDLSRNRARLHSEYKNIPRELHLIVDRAEGGEKLSIDDGALLEGIGRSLLFAHREYAVALKRYSKAAEINGKKWPKQSAHLRALIDADDSASN